MSEEEKGYEIKEKRKVWLDEDGEAHVQEAATSESAAEVSAEAEEDTQEQGMPLMPDVDVYSLLSTFISVLSMHVWHWMGLMKNPATGEMDKDLAQAKTAIDTISSMAAQLEGKIGASEQKALQGLLSDLRINFVQQSAKD